MCCSAFLVDHPFQVAAVLQTALQHLRHMAVISGAVEANFIIENISVLQPFLSDNTHRRICYLGVSLFLIITNKERWVIDKRQRLENKIK